MKLSDLQGVKLVSTPHISTAAMNNPFNIKVGSAMQKYIKNGDASVGRAAPDGGNFLTFKDRNTAINAAKNLLFSSGVYKGLTVDAALKKWSNNGYGGNIIPSLSNKSLDQLTPDQQTQVLQAMEMRGENDAVPTGVKRVSDFKPGQLSLVSGAPKPSLPPQQPPVTAMDVAKEVPGTVAGMAKGAANLLTSSEQAFGKDIAGAIQGAPNVSTQKSAQLDQQLEAKLKALVASGQGNSPLAERTRQMLSAKSQVPTAEQLNPTLGKSNLSILGDAAGVALDVASAGTYGGAAKGMETGKLALPLTKVPTAVSAVKDVAQTAAKSQEKKTVAKIAQVVAPKMTPTKLAEEAAQQGTKKSLLTGKITVPVSKETTKIAQTVAKYVPDFKPGGLISDNLNKTKQAVSALASELKQKVIANGEDKIYSFRELRSAMNAVEKPISIKSDATLSRQFELAKQAALQIAKKNGGKISSLLDARKEFDALVEKEFPTLYDRENAPMRSAISAMRGAMNDFIEKNLPEVGYKDSLHAQSTLLTAIDNMSESIASGAGKEIGTTRLGRFATKHPVITTAAKYVPAGIAAGAVGAPVYNEAKKVFPILP